MGGDHNVICDKSGFKVRASQTVMEEGTNLRVLRRFADKKHPQDESPKPRPTAPATNPRPEPADTFLSSTVLASDL